MKRIPLTRGKFAMVDDEDYERVNRHKWCLLQGRYAHRNASGKWVRMHRFILGALDGTEVDHINGDGLDNQKENLRLCEHRENSKNMRLSRANNTGHKDIYFDKTRGKWAVQVMSDGKKHYGGRFEEIKDAITSRDNLVSELHGDFARTETFYGR